ncbi:MAG: diadenylate cyclase [Verrucomicrobiales bacterium]|nr:diadenylate cyclase [Verrucomicrobiales bacterium]
MKSTTLSQDSAPTEYAETRLLVEHGFDLARGLGISRVLVHAGLVSDQRLVEKHRKEETLIWVTDKAREGKLGSHEFFVEIPGENTNRISQVTLGVIMAVFHGVVDPGESVVCLTGLSGSKRLDNLLIVNPKRDFPWFSKNEEDSVPKFVSVRELLQILTIALRFASEGREGKPIGTIFVLGEPEELKPYLRPLILNPLKGHNQKTRSIYDSSFHETMRELSAIDGAFIINPRGIVESAGMYLDAPASASVELPKGLGARHVAAATITAKTESVAIVISESSRKITVFCRGLEVMMLDGDMSR